MERRSLEKQINPGQDFYLAEQTFVWYYVSQTDDKTGNAMNDKTDEDMREDTGELCARCGKTGEDRRTLWMACMYSMEETGLPLEQKAIVGHVVQRIGEKHIGGALNLKVTEYAEPDLSEKPYRSQFYTLRVCKRCRAGWMLAIKRWFDEDSDAVAAQAARQVRPGMITIDGQVPIRILGATVLAAKTGAEQFCRVCGVEAPTGVDIHGPPWFGVCSEACNTTARGIS